MSRSTRQTVRIATRRSDLAVRQGQIVAQALRAAHPGMTVKLVGLRTSGDRQAGPLAPVGGKGLFTAELEDALRAGRVDLAVHSAKDLPAVMSDDLAVAAVPRRGDPRDALLSDDGCAVADLPPKARVGTGSPRRRAQLLAVRPDLDVVAIRGNVDTRVRKALGGDGSARLDAVVLAMAGLNRAGLAGKHARNIHPIGVEAFIPAAGQGALVVQCAAGDETAMELCGPLDDADARKTLMAERVVVRALGANCHSCLAVHVCAADGGWQGLGMAAAADGSGRVNVVVRAGSAGQAGRKLLETLRSKCAENLLRR